MKPWLKRAALTAALALAVIVYALLLWRGPWWIDGDHLRTHDLQPADGVVITGVRTALVALGAGAIAALGLYYTHHTLQQTRKRDDDQAKATTEGQINERYVEAVKLLAAEDSLTQRLGGIYALERNMHDSDRDHPTVIAILSAFIRSSAPAKMEPIDPKAAMAGTSTEGRPEQDVQAALDVIGRRPAREPRIYPDLSRTDLTGANLNDGDLRGANLSGTELVSAHLVGADLRGADLSHAILMAASLMHSDLRGADCTGAKLDGAELLGADLRGANLTGAELVGADLTGANLTGANLTGAELTDANLTGADLTGTDLTGANPQDAIAFGSQRVFVFRSSRQTLLPDQPFIKPQRTSAPRFCSWL
ncbi:pentapeptide repeat-containing protein [Streptomyces sp. NPDC056638]|uniref:pentapeptide repeat-containing protein n=1 Tax=Streptomyces sp. NPDC056638 TaxID=3345887 RepID=UPI0036935D92